MIDGKHIVFSYIFINILLLISAAKNDCGENRENIDYLAYRFLNNTKPLRYQVYLDPCISDGNFSGYVNIDLLILRPTKNLSLHSQELALCEEGVYLTFKGNLNESLEVLKAPENSEYKKLQDSDELSSFQDSSETLRPSRFIYYKKEQIVTMEYENFLKPGRYSLEINYMGVINSDSVGIYRKYYKDSEGDNRVMLLTNFYPTSARRIFPCRDEPALKSEIYFTLQTSLNFTTITAITPENYIEYREGQRWTRFQPVINTSTYQFNFAILNNMKNLTKVHENKTYITYATINDLKFINLTQEIHEKAMTIMEEYTKFNHPLNTFINLVIPEKTEIRSSSSLGFITTKKSYTSYNEGLGPQKKKDVLLNASRNIVSQWFSQLISPASWKYMWLNEGLTEYIKYYIADKIMPDWHLKDMFAVWELQRRSFIPNKITDSPPLNKNIPDNPKDIQCLLRRSFSINSMSASIIRMMSHFLSENVLQTGIIQFLKTNKYSSVKPGDFWKAVQYAVNTSKDDRLVDINVANIMETWTNTEFYPVVNVTRNYTTGSIKVTQIPAVTLFGLTERNVTDKWWIPINYATQTSPNFNITIPSQWLRPDIQQLIIDGVNPKDWVIFNIQQTGYYRVLYDEKNWKRLASYLNSDNYYKISPINRAQIINDAIQFSLKRQLNMNIFFNLISYLQRETDYIPWYDAQFILSFLNYHLSNTQAYNSLKKFSLRLIVPLVDKIGYEDRPGDDFSTLLLRRISNHWACHFGYEKCWNNATKQLEAHLDDATPKLNSIDLQEWSRCVGLYGANETLWNKMYQKYQENISEDTLIYLACSENATILNKLLDISIANDSIILKKQVLFVFKSVCLYPSGDDKRINLCLKFIDKNFDNIKYRLENSTESFTYLLDLLASEIRQKSQLEQFRALMSQERASFALNRINARIKQAENRVSIFEQKANYYQSYLKASCED